MDHQRKDVNGLMMAFQCMIDPWPWVRLRLATAILALGDNVDSAAAVASQSATCVV